MVDTNSACIALAESTRPNGKRLPGRSCNSGLAASGPVSFWMLIPVGSQGYWQDRGNPGRQEKPSVTFSTVSRMDECLVHSSSIGSTEADRICSCRARVRDQQIKCIPRASPCTPRGRLHRCELPRPQSPNSSHAMASDPNSRRGDRLAELADSWAMEMKWPSPPARGDHSISAAR